jgi:hypothetical protein
VLLHVVDIAAAVAIAIAIGQIVLAVIKTAN